MILVLLTDREPTVGSGQAFSARGKLRYSNQLPAFVKIGALFTQNDFHRGLPRHPVPIPIGNGILRRP